MVPEFCKKCGSNEFYTRGKYFRCVPCHRATAKKSVQRRKLNQKLERKNGLQTKSLKKLLREKPISEPDFIVANREKTHCPKGHLYSDETTRVAGQGKYRDSPNRHCRICNKNEARRRYGIEEDHSYREVKKISDFLLDSLDDVK